MASNVHPIAKSAFSVSGSSGLYDRARPSYPESAMTKIFAAAERILSSSSSSPKTEGIDVVELGPGTGIFTRLLLSPPPPYPKNIISSVIGVEPSPGMREGFSTAMSSYSSSTTNIEVKDGSFTNIPLEDNGADMICIAQAFHWAHPNYDAAAKEFARVLKPGGYLVLIWNLEDREAAEWVARIRDAYEEFEDGTPQYRHMYWKDIFDMESYKQNFSSSSSSSRPSETEGINETNGSGFEFYSIGRGIPTTEQGVVDRALSKSYITNLTDEKKKVVEEKVRGVLRDIDEEISEGERKRVWIDKQSGVFEYPYKTDLYIIQRV